MSDLISRQAVLDLVNADWKYEGLEEPINSLPPVNPQKPKSEWEHDHEIIKAYSDSANAVLVKIRAEIEHMIPCSKEALSMKLGVLEIIDKYKAEGSGE